MSATKATIGGVGTGEIMGDGRTGLVIIRAWIEEGSSEPLRAEVRVCTDVANGLEHTLTTARADEVCGAVREWLEEMLRQEGAALT